jgi:hypothetical protein
MVSPTAVKGSIRMERSEGFLKVQRGEQGSGEAVADQRTGKQELGAFPPGWK